MGRSERHCLAISRTVITGSAFMCPRPVVGLRDPVTLTWRSNPDLAEEVRDLLHDLLPVISNNGHVVIQVCVVKVEPVMIEVAVEKAAPSVSTPKPDSSTGR